MKTPTALFDIIGCKVTIIDSEKAYILQLYLDREPELKEDSVDRLTRIKDLGEDHPDMEDPGEYPFTTFVNECNVKFRGFHCFLMILGAVSKKADTNTRAKASDKALSYIKDPAIRAYIVKYFREQPLLPLKEYQVMPENEELRSFIEDPK